MSKEFDVMFAANLIGSGGGGTAPTLIEKDITANGTYIATNDNADGYSTVDVDVPNTYTVGDEGKVVDNGALVSQTAYPTEITANDTYDTTLYNSITVNVPTGGATIIDLIERDITTLNIPSGTTKIGQSAFYLNSNLTSVTIPSSVESIEDSAFWGCSSLSSSSITFSEGLRRIANNAFRGCKAFTSLVLPDGLTSLSGQAFYSCPNLISVTIPSSVTSIGNLAFGSCNNLTTITVNKAEGSISGAPWGATNATVTWTG